MRALVRKLRQHIVRAISEDTPARERDALLVGSIYRVCVFGELPELHHFYRTETSPSRDPPAATAETVH